jgi:hypothetical protein
MIANLSGAQEKFVRDMLAEVFADAPAGTADIVLDRNVAAGLFATRQSARTAIDKLIVKRDACRVERRAAGRASDRKAGAPTIVIPDGCYAVEYDGILRFYRAATKAAGHKWAGRQFINRYVSDDLVLISRGESDTARAAIAADVDAAGLRFATESKHCRMCNRRLTDIDTAIVNGGYGPECVKKI